MVESKSQRYSRIGRRRLSRSPLVALSGLASALATVSLVACGAVVGDAFEVKQADDASSGQESEAGDERASRAPDDASNQPETSTDADVQPSGEITYWQSQGEVNFGAPATSIHAKMAADVPAGHTVVVAIQASASITGVTDNLGNEYSLDIYRGTDTTQVYIYHALNQSEGMVTVTATFETATQAVLGIHDYSGIAGADKTSGNTGNGTAIDTGVVKIEEGNQLLFAYARCNTGVVDAPSKDFTSRLFVAGNLSEDRIVPGSGQYSATFTAAGDSGGGAWSAVLATFKGAEQPSP